MKRESNYPPRDLYGLSPMVGVQKCEKLRTIPAMLGSPLDTDPVVQKVSAKQQKMIKPYRFLEKETSGILFAFRCSRIKQSSGKV
jgi:hypothetical protein